LQDVEENELPFHMDTNHDFNPYPPAKRLRLLAPVKTPFSFPQKTAFCV
jgi:hypothetical protein